MDPRDIWLVSPPKNGNTWSQEMIWLLANDLDYEAAKSFLMPDRWNFLDWGLMNDKDWKHKKIAEVVATNPGILKDAKSLQGDPHRPSPKFFKSHLPLSMINPRLLDTCKTFFVARNPKDACLSFYKHCRLFKTQDFLFDLPTFAQMYMNGEVPETPTIPMIIEGWNQRHHPNLCMVFYEALIRDLPGEIKRMAHFLGKSYSDEQIDELADHVHIDNFRKNPFVNMDVGIHALMKNEGEGTFIRKGKVGDWVNHFTPELDAKFDAWIEEQLKGTDLKFTSKL